MFTAFEYKHLMLKYINKQIVCIHMLPGILSVISVYNDKCTLKSTLSVVAIIHVLLLTYLLTISCLWNLP